VIEAKKHIMLTKEYRICMPLTVEEVSYRSGINQCSNPFVGVQYQVGQLFMIAKHSAEQSHGGEGVEVMRNEPYESEEHGKGQFTEKRIHLSSRLPSWIKSFVPRIFYVTEKAWNYYPYTITEYNVIHMVTIVFLMCSCLQCSFVPRLSVVIQTRYENNAGTTENVSVRATMEQSSWLYL